MRKYPCTICSGERKDIEPGKCISGDIVPISPPAHDGSTMFFLFADVDTGFMLAFTAKAKNSFLHLNVMDIKLRYFAPIG